MGGSIMLLTVFSWNEPGKYWPKFEALCFCGRLLNRAPLACSKMRKHGCSKKSCGVIHPAELAYTQSALVFPPGGRGGFGENRQECIRKIFEWLKKRKKSHVYYRDIYRQFDKNRFCEDLDSSIEEIVNQGCLVKVYPEYERSRGKVPSQLYVVEALPELPKVKKKKSSPKQGKKAKDTGFIKFIRESLERFPEVQSKKQTKGVKKLLRHDQEGLR